MTDIDFEELDRAVNSLMNQRQQDSDRASDSPVTDDKKAETASVADDKKIETTSVSETQTTTPAPVAEVEKTEIKPISESNEPKESTPTEEPVAPSSTFGHVFIAPEAKPEASSEPEATDSPEATDAQPEPTVEEPVQSEPVVADQVADEAPAPEVEDKAEKSVFAPPVTPRHTGRVMDVVAPSSMSAAAMTARPASAATRTNTVVADPMVNPVRAPRMDASGNHKSESSSTPAETAAPTLDTTDLANAISQSLSSTEQSADTSSFAQATAEQPATSLASPFVSNASATIEKRPLGSYGAGNTSDENGEVSMVSPDLMGTEATDDARPAPEKNDLGGKPRLSLEPSSEVAAEESVGMNSDLDRELMALEMGIEGELADGNSEAPEEEQTPEVAATVAELDSLTNESNAAQADAPEESVVGHEQPVAEVESENTPRSAPSFEQQAAASVMSSNEPVETSTPEPAPMFEAAAAQPQPVEEKKPSGVMSFIIILILLLLGAGGGAAAYYFLLVQ